MGRISRKTRHEPKKEMDLQKMKGQKVFEREDGRNERV